MFLAFVFFLLVWKGVKVVPQQQAWVIENLGRFDKILEPGLNFLIPFLQRVAYKHSLKEDVIDIPQQSAITRDNVTLDIDGVLYLRVMDPKAASYGVSDPYFALAQLAQTNMRSEIGKITLDNTFEERENLNAKIVNSINEAAHAWGIQCMRYEIKDINPPATVLQAMELQVAAERKKRAEILDSEGRRDAQINLAEADKRDMVLQSEASMTDQINRAKGEAEAIISVATATAEGIRKVAESIQSQGGSDAVSLRIAEQYILAFKQLAKESNTILLPANANDISGLSSIVAQSVSIFDSIRKTNSKPSSGA
ncbi:MAG: paraslipin [Alphaproteobacteria bacterium CG11_big_fil_rev_8_21_14_0_20_39_49]|nr:MAG: paraslipin [Alphaproteobacteria bacterium CG11_big_fil_rev_8_21_14_0_20_39_49]